MSPTQCPGAFHRREGCSLLSLLLNNCISLCLSEFLDRPVLVIVFHQRGLLSAMEFLLIGHWLPVKVMC